MPEPRCPFALWRPGPAGKAGYPQGYSGPKRGDVKHSAEGGWGGLYSVLDSPTRRASWQFTVAYDRIEQHYGWSVNCWHAGDVDGDGGVRANIDLVGIEHLGVAGEPLTLDQIDMTTRLTAWLAEQNGYQNFGRYPQQSHVWSLAEHNQVSDVPTACPSGRIPWSEILRRLEDDDMTQEQYDALTKAIYDCQSETNKGLAKISSDIQDLLAFLKLALINLDQDHVRAEELLKKIDFKT